MSSPERNGVPPLSLHTSPVPPFPILKRPTGLAGFNMRKPWCGARPEPLEAEQRAEHAPAAPALEQIAQVELDHLARGRDPRPVKVQQLVCRDARSVHMSRAGQTRDGDRKEQTSCWGNEGRTAGNARGEGEHKYGPSLETQYRTLLVVLLAALPTALVSPRLESTAPATAVRKEVVSGIAGTGGAAIARPMVLSAGIS